MKEYLRSGRDFRWGTGGEVGYPSYVTRERTKFHPSDIERAAKCFKDLIKELTGRPEEMTKLSPFLILTIVFTQRTLPTLHPLYFPFRISLTHTSVFCSYIRHSLLSSSSLCSLSSPNVRIVGRESRRSSWSVTESRDSDFDAHVKLFIFNHHV